MYCGEQQDETTGLYYLRARYMNPETGTFTSMDTYGGSVFDPTSLHKYLYANANPVSYTDPSGYMGLFDTVCASAIGNILFYGISGGLISAGLDLLRQLRISERTGQKIDWGEFWFSAAFGAISGCVFGFAGVYAKAVSSVLIYLTLGVSSIVFCLLSINQAILDHKAELYDLMWFDILFAVLSGYSAFSSFKSAAQCRSASNTAKNTTNTEPKNNSTANGSNNSEAGNSTARSIPSNDSKNLTRVGRWMSKAEYDNMVKTGKVQMSPDGNRAYVASPSDINAFGKQAKPGSVYVEFDVDASTVLPAGKEGWGQIPGPGSIFDRLGQNKGNPPITEMPDAYNINLVGDK